LTFLVNTVAFILSVIFFTLSFRFTHLTSDPGGPALIPQVAAVVTASGCVLYFVSVLLARNMTVREHLAGLGKGIAKTFTRIRELLAFVLIVLMPLGLEYLGFAPGTFVFVICLMMISGIKFSKAVVASVAIAAAIYVGYTYVLGAVLPSGIFFG